MLTKELFISDLKNLGIKPQDHLLVHSSYKSLGPSKLSPMECVEILKEYISDKGTIAMPSFFAGSQFLLALEKRIFEASHSVSELGIISEKFRTSQDVIRSLSPTHSICAWGQKKELIVADHHLCQITVGPGSPFEKMIHENFKILLLGVDHKANTTLHYIENTNGAPTLSAFSYPMTMINEKGEMIKQKMFPHLPGLPRKYHRLNQDLPSEVQSKGKIGQAESFLINSKKLHLHLIPILKKDPMYLIDPLTPSSDLR